jgi:predicted ester cyclase
MTPAQLDEIRLAHRSKVGEAFSSVDPLQRLDRLAILYAANGKWFGPRPFDHIATPEQAVADFWAPLVRAIPDLERREDISLAGTWRDGVWVAVTGHYQGNFLESWLGVAPSKGVVRLRFGEFSRLESGRVVEQYTIVDLPDFLRQNGLWPLAPSLGVADLVPGPREHDGLLRGAYDPAESARSMQLVEAMVAGLMRYDRVSLDSMEQWKFWSEHFTWYGPAGIGTCRGQEHYRRVHQRPFLKAFPDRVGGDHKCRIAEGRYVASTGWPSIRATHAGGGFMGLPATGRKITMRVMDFWKREGGLLDENWVFIDLLDLLHQMDFDVLGRLREAGRLTADS